MLQHRYSLFFLQNLCRCDNLVYFVGGVEIVQGVPLFLEGKERLVIPFETTEKVLFYPLL
jgi:hypothetical protein